MIAMLGVNANAKEVKIMEASVDGLEHRSCFSSILLDCLLVALSFVCLHTWWSFVLQESRS
jgi:hypothetical protein